MIKWGGRSVYLKVLFPVFRRDGMQIFQYNRNMRIIIGLKVDVTNLKSPGKVAEDAHQTMLSVTIPNTLKYAGVRPPVCPPEGSMSLYLTLLTKC